MREIDENTLYNICSNTVEAWDHSTLMEYAAEQLFHANKKYPFLVLRDNCLYDTWQDAKGAEEFAKAETSEFDTFEAVKVSIGDIPYDYPHE